MKRQTVISRCMKVGALVVALALQAPTAFAQDDIRYEDVRFGAGASGATMTGSITGRGSVAYVLGAEAGQRMQIGLAASNGATYFTVFGPGQAPGSGGLAGSDLTGPMVPEVNRFDAVLPSSGNYTVLVYLYRSAARRDETSKYTLDISVTGDTGTKVQGDFADGLQGGPDFLAVATRSAGGRINLRSAPSTSASVVGRAGAGDVVRNLGCRMNEGRRWCRVATSGDPAVEGWAAGDFLREAAGG